MRKGVSILLAIAGLSGLLGCEAIVDKKLSTMKKKIKLEDVPVVVMDSLNQRYPDNEIIRISKKTRASEIKYQFDLLFGTRRLEVEYMPDGILNETDERIAVSSIPPNIVKAVEELYENSEIKACEKKFEDGIIQYELKIRTFEKGNKIKYEITFNEAAEILQKQIKI